MYKKAIEKFEDRKDWYRDIHDYIFVEYDNPYLFCSILASTSPRLSIKRNWEVSVAIYDRMRSGDRMINWHEYGLWPCHAGNLDRILAGEEIHGDKVRAFFTNLCGDYEAVTVDTWVLRFFGFAGWITPRRYEKFADRIQTYAKKVNLKPAELQAIVWCYVRDRAGKSPRSFMDYVEVEV